MNKIMVAAICRDEAVNIDDWYKNVQYADRIVLVDTGSADDTVEVAQYYAGIHEDFQIIRLYPEAHSEPVEYDVARNASFACAEEDMLVMWIDLDERFVTTSGNEDWTRELRELPDHVDAINVMMDFTGDGSITYYQTKGVRGRSHYWKYAVHEILVPYTDMVVPHTTTTFCTHHFQQHGKSYRAFHLPLLQRDFTRYPDDVRVLYYLTRQYAYKLENCIADEDYPLDGIIDQLENVVIPHFEELRSRAPLSDYTVQAALDICHCARNSVRAAQLTLPIAHYAYSVRPDRPETSGQIGETAYYAELDLLAVHYSLECMEKTAHGNFMFDYSGMYKGNAPFFIVKSCLTLQMNDKALLYAITFDRQDLLDGVEGIDLSLVRVVGKNEPD